MTRFDRPTPSAIAMTARRFTNLGHSGTGEVCRLNYCCLLFDALPRHRLCVCVWLSVCLSVCLSVYLSVCLCVPLLLGGWLSVRCEQILFPIFFVPLNFTSLSLWIRFWSLVRVAFRGRSLLTEEDGMVDMGRGVCCCCRLHVPATWGGTLSAFLSPHAPLFVFPPADRAYHFIGMNGAVMGSKKWMVAVDIEGD